MNFCTTRALLGALILLVGVPGFSQPAPQLTSARVTQVQSQLGGVESIPIGHLSTTNGHAGTSINFWIEEYGYGSNPIAKFIGVALTAGPIGTIKDNNNIVVGFTRIFIYSGPFVSGGSFTYQNTSTNYPNTPVYASLNVLPYYSPPVFSPNQTSFFYSEYFGLIKGGGGTLPTPVSYQYQATDPNGLSIVYTLESPTGGIITPNIQISSNGLFTWDGAHSTSFTRSTSCPYPYYLQIYIVATNSHGATAKKLIALQAMYGPLPVCAPPPGDPSN